MTAACDGDDGFEPPAFDLIPDIAFVPDAAPAPRSVSLQTYEYPGSSGVDVGLYVSELDGVREISYTLAWDPTIAVYDFGGIGEHFGSMTGESFFDAALVNGRQGRLRVTHGVAPDRPPVSGSGFPHFVAFNPCVFEEGCQDSGTTGLFLEDVALLDDSGAPIAATWTGGRLVVTR